MNPNRHKIVVVDLSDGWGAQEQFEKEGNLQIQGIPYTVVLAPGTGDSPLVFSYSRNAGQTFGEYLLKELEVSDPDFESKFSKRTETIWNEKLIPSYEIDAQAENRALAKGLSKDEAKQSAIRAVVASSDQP